MIGGKQSYDKTGITMNEIEEERNRIVFDEFTRKDLDKLVRIMIKKMDDVKLNFSVMIKLGDILAFQYIPSGTNNYNIDWMKKKIKTVEYFGESTMALWVRAETSGVEKCSSGLMPAGDIVMCGGGYPIKLKNGELVGIIAVSGPGDQNDHYFCVECLDELLADRQK